MNENIKQNTIELKSEDGNVQICDTCHTKNPPAFYFCPNCGKLLRKKPLSTSIFKQLGIYLLSIFLPPLGLWPGIRYLRGKTTSEKLVGITAIALTLIVTIITVLYTMELVKSFQSMLNMQLQSPDLQNSLNQQLKKQIENQYNFK